jgi:plasmid stabilization system protein ParE
VTARNVHYTTQAYEDLTSILLWLSEAHGLEGAEKVDLRLERAIASLESMPDRGRRVPELQSQGDANHRELIVAPYRIVYYALGREVWVIAIVDGRRDVKELLLARARRSSPGTRP